VKGLILITGEKIDFEAPKINNKLVFYEVS
jgi:hypothetical protein